MQHNKYQSNMKVSVMIYNTLATDVIFQVTEFTELTASFRRGTHGRPMLQKIFFTKHPALQPHCFNSRAYFYIVVLKHLPALVSITGL